MKKNSKLLLAYLFCDKRHTHTYTKQLLVNKRHTVQVVHKNNVL
jgi:hypothetical protein